MPDVTCMNLLERLDLFLTSQGCSIILLIVEDFEPGR
jgi:hypothetical protein